MHVDVVCDLLFTTLERRIWVMLVCRRDRRRLFGDALDVDVLSVSTKASTLWNVMFSVAINVMWYVDAFVDGAHFACERNSQKRTGRS